MSGIEAVVLDIGNVLIEWRPERHYDRTIGRARREALFTEVDLYEMNLRIDLGEDFRGVVYETAERIPHWHAEIRDWHDSWLSFVVGAVPGSATLLRRLRAAGVPVFALSNFGAGPLDLAEAAYPFLTEFDRRYISGHLGVIKPDPEIYAIVEAECGIAPDRLLFTDDSAANIAAAVARGWRTHLFEGAEGWDGRLRAEKLLPSD